MVVEAPAAVHAQLGITSLLHSDSICPQDALCMCVHNARAKDGPVPWDLLSLAHTLTHTLTHTHRLGESSLVLS